VCACVRVCLVEARRGANDSEPDRPVVSGTRHMGVCARPAHALYVCRSPRCVTPVRLSRPIRTRALARSLAGCLLLLCVCFRLARRPAAVRVGRHHRSGAAELWRGGVGGWVRRKPARWASRAGPARAARSGRRSIAYNAYDDAHQISAHTPHGHDRPMSRTRRITRTARFAISRFALLQASAGCRLRRRRARPAAAAHRQRQTLRDPLAADTRVVSGGRWPARGGRGPRRAARANPEVQCCSTRRASRKKTSRNSMITSLQLQRAPVRAGRHDRGSRPFC
jgi:hypothetical protein